MRPNKMTLPPFTLLPETKTAIDAAIKAGKSVLEVYNSKFNSSKKQDNEPITLADTESQKIILKELSSFNHPFLSEESEDNKKRLIGSKVWIIDPLDGTSDFINKTGEFSIMLALVQNHKPLLGIIYQPTENKLFIAEKGKGAYKLEKNICSKLSVNSLSDLNKCKAVLSRHHLAENEKQFISSLNISKFTQKGSCGLKVAELCSKNAELYFTTTNKIRHWDTCAAHCLITESGGRITDMLGNELVYNTELTNHPNGLLVTNGILHAQILAKYNEFLANNINQNSYLTE